MRAAMRERIEAILDVFTERPGAVAAVGLTRG